MSFILPEKNYFSIDEICERWGCDREQLYHYIFEQHSLRLSFKFADFLSCLRSLGFESRAFMPEQLFPIRPQSCFREESYITYPLNSPIASQKYFYLDAPKISGSDDVELFDHENIRVLVTDHLQNKFELMPVEEGDPQIADQYFLEGACPLDYSAYDAKVFGKPLQISDEYYQHAGEHYEAPWIWSINQFFIMKEERDRFERSHAEMAIISEHDRSAHEAAEGPLPPSLQAGNESSLRHSPYWQELERKAEQAISDFPAWAPTVRKIQKTTTLHEWLRHTIGLDERETEIIKKALSDIFPELQ